MSATNKRTVLIILVVVILMAAIPFFALKGAEFGGSDDAGSVMISEIQGQEYEPWLAVFTSEKNWGKTTRIYRTAVRLTPLFCGVMTR